MITFPQAKINLGLNIVARRADGYHELETVFYPIPLTDALEIVPASGDDIKLECSGNAVDCPPEKNLVVRAARLMQRTYSLPPVDIYLHKHIPDGAGLGGGSSDAASVMTMMRQMFELDVDDAELARLAATLGADCPFFIYSRPMAATGIGDVLEPVDVPALSGKTLLVAKPAAGVSTAEAYSRVVPQPVEVPAREIVTWPLPMWDGALKNDFEPSVFARLPQLWIMKASLLDAGAQYASMSGSGSSMFGVFDTHECAERAAESLPDVATFLLEL